MTGSTRPRLRSVISHGHSHDDLSEGTSARTRPLSYDEIMCRRKSKKQADGSREEARGTGRIKCEETVKNLDHHSRDAHAAALKYSRNHGLEPSSRKKEEKSSRMDDAFSKSNNKESHDMGGRNKHKYEKDLRNGMEEVKTDRRGHVRGKLEEENQVTDSKSKHRHDKDVKNGTEVVKTDRRRHVSGRINEESHDMNTRYKDKHEKSVKNRTPYLNADKHGNGQDNKGEASQAMNTRCKDKDEKSEKNSTLLLKADKRGNVRDIQDDESHDLDGRFKIKREKDVRNNTEELKNNRLGDVRSKQGEILRDAANYAYEDRHHRDSVVQNRYMGRGGGAFEREKKRKDRNVDDEKHKFRDPVKKHDSGSRRDSEISERKAKMEFSHLRQDDSRPKRRRSRSQEQSKDKDRRSRSASPKGRKSMSSREHEHPLSLLSHREKSRHGSDVDRTIMPYNGSTSHHQPHSEFSSGLGGYSPRKRKSDVAVKTPSPIRSPERKRAGLDLPSSGVDKNHSSSVASGSQLVSQTMSSKIGLVPSTSAASSVGMPLSSMFYHSLSTFKDASVDSVQLTQATRPMRRLYVDNIPTSASEKEIMESFNAYLLSFGYNHIRGTRPCISCMIHKEKGQALLEFLTPEDASAALSFDGRSLYGSMLKIRRPKDYVGMASGSVEILKAESGKNNAISDVAAVEVDKDVLISDVVKDSPHKIFVGGIAEGLSSEMLMEIFSVLGPLKAFRFATKENLNKTCVFLEYTDHSVTSKACAALNGMKLGGRILTVSQAIPDTSFEENSLAQPFYGIPEHVKPLLETPTLVLKLSNLLDQKALELLPELQLEEIMEDVQLECSRFGSVLSVNVVKPSNLHTAISDAKEATIEEVPCKEGECHDHNMNMGLLDAAIKHNVGESDVWEPLTNVENDLNIVDEGESADLATATATATAVEAEAANMSTVEVKETDVIALQEHGEGEGDVGKPLTSVENELSTVDNVESADLATVTAIEVEAANMSAVEVKENDVISLKEYDDEAANDPQEFTAISDSTIKNTNNMNASENGVANENACDIFEVGCIFVEFRRTEASCMAAHCLHGRLFDDRVVAVEYVPLSAYRVMFPK